MVGRLGRWNNSLFRGLSWAVILIITIRCASCSLNIYLIAVPCVSCLHLVACFFAFRHDFEILSRGTYDTMERCLILSPYVRGCTRVGERERREKVVAVRWDSTFRLVGARAVGVILRDMSLDGLLFALEAVLECPSGWLA